ncbi:MAG: transporter [Clostridiales bacterium]|nr:transporter [Clostridiales bacterium]
MEEIVSYGILSIVPALLAVTLAFITKEAIFSLLIACITGVFILGDGLFGITSLIERACGNEDFLWVLLIEVFVGVLIAFFQISGSTEDFSNFLGNRAASRKKVQIMGWCLSLFIFFSDYFSPLFVGNVMRNLTDKAKVSREKLAYLCDSTSAPMCVLIPFTSWGVYLAGLLIGMGPIADANMAMTVFTKSVMFNFYGIITVLMVGLIAVGVIPDFGPMKKAEKRAYEEGKLIRDGSTPMMGVEISELVRAPQLSAEFKPTRLAINFLTPILIIICIAVGSFFIFHSTKTLEAFVMAVFFLGVALIIQKIPLKDVMKAAVQGIKGVIPAILILALAYCINSVSKDLGAAIYVTEVTKSWLSPSMLPAITFFTGAFIAFSTGTSWGTFAILMPISVPMALQFSGGEVSTLVCMTIASIAGGGVFGDHCSPISDTTVLSSFGAASDHMDHVRTQIPYALTVAGLVFVIYIIFGIIG